LLNQLVEYMNHTKFESSAFNQIERFYSTYPTALIDIISEYYPLNMSSLGEYPALNWQKISSNEKINWDKWNFRNHKSKLEVDQLCKNKGFLDSSDLIEILQENPNYFDLNIILKNIGVTNFKPFFKEFVANKNHIDHNLIKYNYDIIQSPRLVRFINKYIDSDENKISLKSYDQDLSKQVIETSNSESAPSNYSINSIILNKIKNIFKDVNDIDSIKCENTIELYNILAKTPSIYNMHFRYSNSDLNKAETEYLNNLPLDNELFIALINLNEIFFIFFKCNKYLVWDVSLFEELSDLNPWLYVDELKGNFLTSDFLIKYSNRINLTQKLFEKFNWTMPVIFSMGWEDIFYRQFEIRSLDYDYERGSRWDDIYIDLNLGNMSQDVIIYYYPLLFKNYIDSNLEIEMEVILSDLDKLKYLNKSLITKLSKKVGSLISSTLTTNQIKLILQNCSKEVKSWYKLPRFAQFYCSEYSNATRFNRLDSIIAPISRFHPEIVSAFKKDQIPPIFTDFFIIEQSIKEFLRAEIISIKDAKILNLEFIDEFDNLKYLLLTDCSIEDSKSYEFKAIYCLYISKCIIDNLNFVYSFKDIHEFYFLTNVINSKDNSPEDIYVRGLQSVFLENHITSEIRIDYSQTTKIALSNTDLDMLCEGAEFVGQLPKLESIIISRLYKFTNLEKRKEDMSEMDIFDLYVNQQISSCITTFINNIKNLCLVNLLLDPLTLDINLKNNVNVLICHNFIREIYEQRYGIPDHNSISNLLYDSQKHNLEHYLFILENKRFPDKIHENLLYDEREDYYNGYEDQYYDEANFDAYTDGQYGNYYDDDGNGRDIDPEMLGL